MSLLLLFRPRTPAAPPPATNPGGGGFGVLMDGRHFERYQERYKVSGAWQRVKRVKV